MKGYAARDAEKYSEAADALRKLVGLPSPGGTGRDLFGAAYGDFTWRNRLMRKLEQKGLVLVTEAPRGGAYGRRPKIYETTPELTAIVETEDIGPLLWGSGEPPRFEVGEEEPQLELPAPVATDKEPGTAYLEAFLADERSTRETLEALLKLTAAVLENVVVIRQGQEAFVSELTELRKAWE